MAQLVVGNLEEAVVVKLKQRALAQGHSAEAEHRAILQQALRMSSKPKRSFKEALLAMPEMSDDDDFERSQDVGRSIDL